MSTAALPTAQPSPAAPIAIGIGIAGAAAAVTVLPALTAPGAALAVFLLAGGGCLVAALRPAWLVALWAALVWSALGEHLFGGLPSPVEVGAIALTAFGLWQHRDDLALVRTVGALMALLALPALAAALLSPEGSGIPSGALRELPFLAVAALAVHGDAAMLRVATGLVVAGVVLGAGGAWSVIVGPTALFPLNASSAVFDPEAPRAAGPFGEANFFALSLAALVPFALLELRRGGLHAWLGAAGVAALLAGVLSTGSRGGLVACAVALVGGALWERSRRSAAVLLLGLGLVPVFGAQVLGAGTRPSDGRTAEARIALAMWADRPVVGTGPGGYPVRYRDYARQIADDPRSSREPHSLPLQILAEQGIVGAVCWLTAGLVVVGGARRSGVARSPVGRAALLALATFAAGSVFLHGSRLRLLYVLAGLVVALGAARRREATT